MTSVEILILFQEIFHVKDEIDEWFPNGKNSIRVRFKKTTLPFELNKDGELIFTAESRDEWRLETIDSWIKSIPHLTLYHKPLSKEEIIDIYSKE